MIGTYAEYFAAGTIRGAFNLAPQETSFMPAQDFASQSWAGTLTITGGTGAYKGIKGANKRGTLVCTSPDSVHLTCNEKIKVKAL